MTFPACLEKVDTEALAVYPLREVKVGLEEVSAGCLSDCQTVFRAAESSLRCASLLPCARTDLAVSTGEGRESLRWVTFVGGLEVIKCSVFERSTRVLAWCRLRCRER